VRVFDAFEKIASKPGVTDKSDRPQVEAAVYGFLEDCTNLAAAQQTLFLKELLHESDTITGIDKVPDDVFSRFTHKELVQGIVSESRRFYVYLMMSSFLTLVLVNLATLLVESAADFDSMRNTMLAYSDALGKFKTLVESKATGKDVETWFNTIWDRQVKRGVIR
jgi:hypothetical protein